MDLVAGVAYALLGAAAVAALARLWMGPAPADRLVALDLLLVVLAAGLGVQAARTGSGLFVTVLVVVALIAFAGTLMVAPYLENREEP